MKIYNVRIDKLVFFDISVITDLYSLLSIYKHEITISTKKKHVFKCYSACTCSTACIYG